MHDSSGALDWLAEERHQVADYVKGIGAGRFAP
jgi:hypothetical protein